MAEVAPERREPPLPSDNSRSDLVASAAASAAAASAPDQHPNTTTTMAEGNGDAQVDATKQLQSQSQLPPSSSSSTSTAPPARPPSPPSNPSPRPDTHREASMASSSHKMAISDDDEERERARGAVAGSSTDPRRNDRDDTDADETVQPPRSRVRMRSERANVLDEAAKRRHRRRPSTDSAASSAGRSRTPSPILGRASTTALVTRSDIQAILYNSSGQSAYGGVEAAKPQTFADSSEINAVIASVEGMDLRDQGSDLAAMVRKLGQHALEQDTYIRSMEESMHNTRVTAVSVISNLTASHAYELAQERQLRDRLEVELEGAQASARMLSSLLNKSQTKSREMDRQRAASVEEEMKWAASLPGAGLRKPSATAVAGANAASAATSPHPPPPTTPPKSMGLGITDTTTTPSSSTHHPQDVFDSPMSAVIAERNKLAADKRYLRNRVRDAEAQLHRLENELKALRPLLVQGTGGSGGSGAKAMLSAPSTPHRSRDQVVPMTGGSSATTPGNRSSKKASSGSSRRRRPTTLGDAEAEHLLLAARRLNSVRAQQQQQEAGTDAGSPVARPRTPPPRLGPGIPPKTPSSTATLTARTPRTIKHAVGGGSPVKLTSRNGKASLDAMPPSPAPVYDGAALMGSPQAKARALARERGDGSTFEPRHERVDSTASHISHTSQASHAGMDELLHAAQSVLTPRDRAAAAQQQAAAPNNYFPPAAALPKTHDVAQRPPSYFESPKRRRVSMSAGDADWAAQQRIMSASPQQRYANPLHHKSSFPLLSSSPRRARTRTEGAERDRAGGASDADEPPLSALDLLADQAAASQNPSQSSEPSSSDNERRDDDQRRHAGGFSSQEENGDDDGGPPRGISGLPPPRSAASSLMAARSRVNAGPSSSGAPIAYAHSVAPHSDYGSPRYAQGPPPLPPSGHGGMIGSPVSHGSSPLLNNEGYALPPIHTGLPPPPPPPHGMHSAAGGHYGSGLPPPPPPPPGMPLHPHHHHHHMPYAHHGPYSPHGGMNGTGSPNIPLPPTPSAYLSPNSADANGFAPLPGGAHGHRSSASYDGGVTGGGPPKPSTSSSTSSTASAAAASASSKPKGGNTSPDKRLPYVRWTSEEDEKLKRAIAQYGQRWEAVAKAVGTRSYHQCRQRALLMRRKGVDPAAAGRAGASGGGAGQRGSGSASAASASGSPVGEEGEEGEDGGGV